jgi:CMP-N-acetylneuraminic acid synthetase
LIVMVAVIPARSGSKRIPRKDIDTAEDWRQAELMYAALMTAAAPGTS